MGAVIRCDPLDGEWQTLGTERYRGIVPEGIEATANPWGPDQLSFNVKAVVGVGARPDLLPYTPVELEVDGILVWAGRIKARPSGMIAHQVQCEGWQYHLDDDVYDRAYVHTRMGDYRDQRSYLGADLTKFTVGGTVTVENGAVVIGWPQGTVVPANGSVGVTLDLGPDSTAKRAVLNWVSSNNTANIAAVVRGTTVENATDGSAIDPISFALTTGASGTTAGTFSTERRYVTIFLLWIAGGTTAADFYLRVTGIQLFRSTAYEAFNLSKLHASDVVKDARSFAPLLNQTDDYVIPTTFNVPEAVTQGYQSPREVTDWVNAYENNRTKIGGDDLKSLVYDAKPSNPVYEVGEGSASEFADASIAGDEIYSRAVVDGTGPDGARLVSSQTQTGTLVDRNGFARAKVLPIRSAVTSAVADRFAQLWLTEHVTSPFSGKLVVTNGIKRHIGGASVPPHALLRAAGEKIRLMHRLDPDTGGWGRDGRIAGVSYSHDTRTVSIDIDDRRDHFESILARYGILVDQLG